MLFKVYQMKNYEHVTYLQLSGSLYKTTSSNYILLLTAAVIIILAYYYPSLYIIIVDLVVKELQTLLETYSCFNINEGAGKDRRLVMV